jgi:hypothetical protein
MPTAETNRRVYGRGFHDGYRNAMQERATDMNVSRFKSILDGLGKPAQVVFNAVPIREEWTILQIHTELTRAGRYLKAIGHTAGVLNNLAEAGIIKESPPGSFRALRPHESQKSDAPKESLIMPARRPTPEDSCDIQYQPASEKKEAAMSVQKTTLKLVETGPMDSLLKIIEAVDAIVKSASELKSKIEVAAIEIEDQFTKKGEESAKLRQLQKILKELA